MTDKPGGNGDTRQELAERFNLALWATDSAIWDLDIERKQFWSSSGHQLLFGRGNEEITEDLDIYDDNNAWASHLHPEDRAQTIQCLRDHLENDNPYDVEYRYRLPSGDYIWIRSVARAVRASDGRPLRLLGLNEDISERKTKEKALHESQAQFRSLFENAIVGVTITDVEGNYISTNAAFRHMLGYSENELAGMRWQDVSAADEIDRIQAGLNKMHAAESSGFTFEKRLFHKNGSTVWAVLHLALISDESRKQPLQTAIVEDITERKVAELENQRLRDAIDNASEAIIVYDEEDRLTYANDRSRNMFPEISHALTPGTQRADIWRTYQASGALGNRAEVTPEEIAHWGEVDGALEVQLADKSWIRVSDHRLADGSVVGVRTDITRTKEREQALMESEARLAEAQRIGQIGSWEWDVESGEERWSDECYRVLGFSIGTNENNFESFKKRVHADDRDGVLKAINEALTSDRPYSLKYRALMPDGSVRHLHMIGEVTLREAGKPLRVSGTVQNITELTLAEEELRHSSSMLAHAQEMAHLASWEIDYKTNTVIWSDELYRIVGLSRAEFDGRQSSYLNLIHPEDRAWIERQSQDLQRGKRFDYTYRIIRPDGEERVVHVQGEVTRSDDDGTPRHARGFLQDVTERAASEEALRESERRLAEAQELALIGSWERNFVTGELLWSNQHYTLYGLKPNSGAPTLEIFLNSVHPDDQEIVRQIIREQEVLGGQHDYEHRIVLPDGSVRIVHERVEPILDNSGSLTGIRGTTQDITERKLAEQAMVENEARLTEAQQIANVGSWAMDIDGAHQTRTFWSVELCIIFGIGQEDVPQSFKAFLQHVHVEDRATVKRSWAEAMERNALYEVENRIVRPDGEVRYVHTKSRSFAGKAPGVRRIIGATTDVTDRKLAEDKLQQAQKMEAVGQLTGGVAHDFNNLLTVIQGNLELIRDSIGDDSAVQDMIDRSVAASRHGAALTHRLLAFSRKQTLMPATLDLGSLILGLTDMLRRTLGETIEIESSTADDLWLCTADQSQLENALLNLAINARDAMPDGGRLTIETANILLGDSHAAAQAELKPGEYVMLAVSDTGSGIPGEDLSHVFEPFFTTKDVGKGTGLGLSMIYGFAKQSGGNVTIHSTQDVGTRVNLYLPRSTKLAGDAETPEAASAAEPTRGEKILVVEDDENVRSLAVNLLNGLGYDVAEAANAEAALTYIESGASIDLLLSDVVLPGTMNGPQLATEITRHVPAAKVVYMTGYAKEAFNTHTELDARAYVLQKPFNRVKLASAIRDRLQENITRA